MLPYCILREWPSDAAILHQYTTHVLTAYHPSPYSSHCVVSPNTATTHQAGIVSVNNHLLSPALRMGLVADTEHDSTAWFLAALHAPYTPSSALTIHFGLIRIGPVLLPLFFLRFSGGGEELLLETSLNPYQADLQGLKLLRCLCSQGSYRIHYRGLATKTANTLDVPNTHHALYHQAVTLLEAHPPWTTTQFVQAQYHLAQAWPTPEERYQNLRYPPGHAKSFDT